MRYSISNLIVFVLGIGFSHTINAQKKITPEEYINKHYPLAVAEMNTYKVPASITLAQGLIETESGNSLLALKANNHFGIKCKAEWTGPTFIKDDDTKNECFRAYGSVEESYRDHSIFLLKPRYSQLFSNDMTDYRSWAYGLKQAGYATNPNYPAMLIKYIEDYKLFQFDNFGLEKVNPDVQKNPNTTKPQTSPTELIKLRKELANNLELVIFDENFDVYKIASNTRQSVQQLMDFNDLEGEQTMRIGQNFFLQKKAKMNNKDKHTVLIGESLYDISQMYGVGLKLLRKYNKLESWEQPAIGEIIYLGRQRDDFIKTRPFYQVNIERIERNLELFIPIKIPANTTTNTDTVHKVIVSKVLPPEIIQSTPIKSEIEPTIIKIDTTEPVVQKIVSPPVQIVSPEIVSSKGEKVWINHQVKPKETIFRISKIYDCKPNEILNWNAITVEQGLKIGQTIRVQTLHPKGLPTEIQTEIEETPAEPKIIQKPKIITTHKPSSTIQKKNSLPESESSIKDKQLKTLPDNAVPIEKLGNIQDNPNSSKVPHSLNQEPATTVPKEPQKPRVTILRAPQSSKPASNQVNLNKEKVNMNDLYKSLINNAVIDTSVNRKIKVSE